MAKKKTTKKKAKAKKSTVVKATTKKTSTTTNSASNANEVGRWNGHKFVVSQSKIMSFGELNIKGSSELKDKKKNNDAFVSRKSGKPIEITMTVYLNAFAGAGTGGSVRDAALNFATEAKAGKSDYFYIGNKKLFTCKLMLTDASVQDIEIASGASKKWVSANVSLTFKQSTKMGSTSNSGSSSSKKKKKSTKSTSPKTTSSSGGGSSSYSGSSNSGSGYDSPAVVPKEMPDISTTAKKNNITISKTLLVGPTNVINYAKSGSALTNSIATNIVNSTSSTLPPLVNKYLG